MVLFAIQIETCTPEQRIGATAEPRHQLGRTSGQQWQNGFPDNVAAMLKVIDEIGGPKHENHFAVGWAWALDTPFQWTKQVASHFGGTRCGVLMSWPARIKAKREVRSQWHHFIDIAPTIYEAAGIDMPEMVNGIKQVPLAGVSMAYTFDNAAAPGRRTTQYFEIFGNRAIYQNGQRHRGHDPRGRRPHRHRHMTTHVPPPTTIAVRPLARR
jgi:arylsulfatase A-like enzyme